MTADTWAQLLNTGDRDDDRSSESRIDLHLHSEASGGATNWWVKGLGLGVEPQESYTRPEDASSMARAAGMDFVTLTDHESIDGALTLADRADFLIGVEVGTVFPEDGSNADVLVYGLDAAAHEQIQTRRPDVYALVAYLREAGLVHVLAHPLFEPGAPLDRAAVEKRLVLFGLWELINGSRPAEQNRLTQQVAASVGAADLRQMARRHGLPLPPHTSIAGTGGSDDHGGVYPGGTWTSLPRCTSVADVLAALAAGEARPGGADGSVDRMTSTGFRITAGALAARTPAAPAGEGRGEGRGDTRGEPARPSPIHRLLPGNSAEAGKISEYLPLLMTLDGAFLREFLTGRYARQVSQALTDTGDGFPLLGVLSSLGSLVDAHLYVAPYLGVHGYFARERQKTRVLRRHLFPAHVEPVRVGLFVDDLDEIHGVSTMYKHLQRLSTEDEADRLRLVRCGPPGPDEAIALPAIADVRIPLYDNRRLGIPSILDVLDCVVSEGFGVLHVATPGPLGLAAMVAGVTLGLPIVGAYHTEFARYAEVLSGDAIVAEIVEVLVREFYERCTVVAVPSASTAASLRARGYRIGRLDVLKNGVDTDLYHPGRRDEALHDALGGGRTLLLYVGRVSREKGLARLAEDYLELRRRRDDLQLVVVGDGPYREELAERLGPAATFTGFVRGEALARIYASCDIFVFPSITDTLGRAVVEAQASGLPAVVCDVGGPQECIQLGVTGVVVKHDDDAQLIAQIEALVDDPARRRRMGEAACAFASTLSWQKVRTGLIDLYREIGTVPAPQVLDHAAD